MKKIIEFGRQVPVAEYQKERRKKNSKNTPQRRRGWREKKIRYRSTAPHVVQYVLDFSARISECAPRPSVCHLPFTNTRNISRQTSRNGCWQSPLPHENRLGTRRGKRMFSGRSTVRAKQSWYHLSDGRRLFGQKHSIGVEGGRARKSTNETHSIKKFNCKINKGRAILQLINENVYIHYTSYNCD